MPNTEGLKIRKEPGSGPIAEPLTLRLSFFICKVSRLPQPPFRTVYTKVLWKSQPQGQM